jgi:hypothetical protein
MIVVFARKKTAVAVTATAAVNTPALSDWSRAKSHLDPARKVNKPPTELRQVKQKFAS